MVRRVLMGIAVVLGLTLPQSAGQTQAADWLAYGYVNPVAYNVVSPYGYHQYASYPYYPYAYVPYTHYPYRYYYAAYPAVYTTAYVNYPSMYYSASYSPVYYYPYAATYPAYPAYGVVPTYATGGPAYAVVNTPAVVAPKTAEKPSDPANNDSDDSAVPKTYEPAPQAEVRPDQPITEEVPAGETYEEPPAPPIAEGQNAEPR